MTVTTAYDLDREWFTTCVHEAGHATAYVVHGQPFKAVKVWGRSTAWSTGSPRQVDPLPHLARVYAGPVAEELYRAGGRPRCPLRSCCLPTTTWEQTGWSTTRMRPARCAPCIVCEHAGRGVLWGMLTAVLCECLLPEGQGRMR